MKFPKTNLHHFAAIVLLGIALSHMPYGYYQILKVIICAISIYIALETYSKRETIWIWIFGVNGVIYNPFFPLHLGREFWTWINAITIICVLGHAIKDYCSRVHSEANRSSSLASGCPKLHIGPPHVLVAPPVHNNPWEKHPNQLSVQEEAEMGDPSSQRLLGDMYFDGDGEKQDFSQALTWYRKAAEQGDEEAQHSLGIMYEYGIAVPRDPATSIGWYKKAAAQAQPDALAALERLGLNPTKKQKAPYKFYPPKKVEPWEETKKRLGIVDK